MLDKESIGECDSRIFFYTEELGKIIAKATSARKIVSRLAAHLEPLNYITARLVSRQNGAAADIRRFQITDALLMDNAGRLKTDSEKFRNTLRAFHLISRIVPEGVADGELWVILLRSIREGIPVTIQDALGFLGFGKDFADCALCRKTNPEYIYPRDNMFVCRYCAFQSLMSLEEFVKL